MRSILGGPRILDGRFDLAGTLTKTETNPSLSRSAPLSAGASGTGLRQVQRNKQSVGIGCCLRGSASPILAGERKKRVFAGGENLCRSVGKDISERCQIGSGFFGQGQISIEICLVALRPRVVGGEHAGAAEALMKLLQLCRTGESSGSAGSEPSPLRSRSSS